MAGVLLAWIGHADLEAAGLRPSRRAEAGTGPIAGAVAARAFREVVLLASQPGDLAERYLAWLAARTKAALVLRRATLRSPTSYTDIHAAAVAAADDARARHPRAALTFHLSPGTPAMAAIWIILGKTRYGATLIESSPEEGVHEAEVPFDLAAEFVPALLRRQDAALERQVAETVGQSFADIVHASAAMTALLHRAERAAVRSVPVLIEGETGTGKDVLARAIHHASPRRAKPFRPINCGAIPEALVESVLFGHVKGAFTGADRDRTGLFASAPGGTVFLDEVGELAPAVQVKLLRVLENKEVVRVGTDVAVPVDARVLAATHRDLLADVTAGRFREDLYYRLAVLPLRVPPLRDRAGDLGPLIDHFLAAQNAEALAAGEPRKKLSAGARNVLLRHGWPGNVRELQATLLRAAVWSTGPSIEAADVADALGGAAPRRPGAVRAAVLDRPLGDGFSLEDTLAEVARHYLARALTEAAGTKTRAAALVGLASHQTLSNWLARYGVEP